MFAALRHIFYPLCDATNNLNPGYSSSSHDSLYLGKRNSRNSWMFCIFGNGNSNKKSLHFYMVICSVKVSPRFLDIVLLPLTVAIIIISPISFLGVGPGIFNWPICIA